MNETKQDYFMKLGEGGEAFFVFETAEDIPESLQTSPLVSPAGSPTSSSQPNLPLNEPEYLDISAGKSDASVKDDELLRPSSSSAIPTGLSRASSDLGKHKFCTPYLSGYQQFVKVCQRFGRNLLILHLPSRQLP